MYTTKVLREQRQITEMEIALLIGNGKMRAGFHICS